MLDEIQSGVCRVCGCREEYPCTIVLGEENGEELTGSCWWVNSARTLCSNPNCLAVVPLDQIERELQQEGNAERVAG